MTRREKAIRKRNIFLSICAGVLVLAIALVVFIILAITSQDNDNPQNSSIESISSDISQSESSSSSDTTSYTQEAPHGLDIEYKNLLLVNGWNPLPQDYDYEGNLTTIPQKYIKGSLTQIDKDIWPYLQAMLDDALAQGIDIGVWSPYRSYDTQKMLFDRKINRLIEAGTPQENAETEAAKVVARPGTSEHHTGLALDINCANDSFEKTKAYEWLKENAEDYGFVMRYSKEKQEKTGVIHESWHWRFVGVKVAREMNDLGMCLEEYVEYKK